MKHLKHCLKWLFKRIFFLFGTLLLLVACITSVFCDASKEPSSLWIVTEKVPSDGRGDALQELIPEFNRCYPEVNLKIEYIPTEDADRKEYLNTIREAIMNGGGPDVYLLPTKDVLVLNEPVVHTYKRVQMLFPDVEKAIRDDMFFDLSDLYNNDSALDKGSLQPEIMSACVLNKGRFVLPLQFQMPVMYVFPETLSSYKIDTSALCLPFLQWAESVADRKDILLSCGAEYLSFNLFSDVIDYNENKVTLDVAELAEYLSVYQRNCENTSREYMHRNNVTLAHYLQGEWKEYPVQLNSISSAPVFAAIAACEKKDIEMVPVYSDKEEVVANVSYYGAIGRNCSEPSVAYQFLRLFLTDKGQRALYTQNCKQQVWPVRWMDGISWIWEEAQNEARRYQTRTLYKVKDIVISQEDIPILDCGIDAVRFPMAAPNILMLYENEIEGCAIEEDFTAVAEQIVDTLSRSLSE